MRIVDNGKKAPLDSKNMQQSDNSIKISVIRSSSQWRLLARTWNEIWSKTPDASVFNSFPFLYTCWSRFLKKDSSLFILVLHDQNNQPIGLAPLMLQRKRTSGFPLRCLVLMFRIGVCDRPQFLIPHRKAEQLNAIFSYLKHHQSEWDILDLTEQVIDKVYADTLSDAFLSQATYHTIQYEQPEQPYLTIDTVNNTWEKYMATRSGNHRKKWRNKNNRLEKTGEITLTRHVGPDKLQDAFQEYRILEKKSWKRNHEAELDEHTYTFYQELSTVLVPEGALHILFLRRNGKPIAGHIGLSFQNRYAALQSVFDRSYESYSPGFLAGGYDMKWVIENGFSEYDFMTGFTSDKLFWTDTVHETSFIRIVRKTAWGGMFYVTKFFIVPMGLRLMDRIRHNRWTQLREEKYENN